MTSVRLKAAIQPGGSMSDSARTHGLPAGSGQADALRDVQARFVEENLRRIFLQIFRIVGNVEDAQDLTQETFIKALQRREQIKDLEKATHWLSRIATNTAIDFLRRHGRLSFTDISELPQPLSTDPGASPERLLLQAEGSAVLQEGLLALSERERTALVLRDVDDVPSRDVAKLLKCSEATVRSHIANARIKFRRFLEGRKA
ncbi:MAG TPA: RNA polymerase sigma factor [Bryobacteraceae bacterium]|nr:RNA polymerase sigma factor [Bryobacteraceae bacterium]